MPHDAMSTEELGQILRQMYETAPRWEKVVQVVHFGILYSDHVKRRAYKIAEAAGIQKEYGGHIAIGVRLAAYVTVKPTRKES